MSEFQEVITASYCNCDIVSSGESLFDSEYQIFEESTIERMAAPRNRTDYGNRLVQARKSAGLKQEELAKLAGISQSTLAAAERRALGSRYTPQLARVLKVNPIWLQDGTGPREGAAVVDLFASAAEPQPMPPPAPEESTGPSPLALELAAMFDELTSRRDRAVAYTRATQSILDVLAGRDALPSDTPAPAARANSKIPHG